MAIVRITPTAWMKIQALVIGYDKEVAWYATVEKLGVGDYRMKDILVYPQLASAAYVEDTLINGDATEMNAWLDSLTDEQFNERRGQGHSHVKMSVTPSHTDKEFWKTFALSVEGSQNPYVVTMIINQRLEMMWWIVDWEDKLEYKNDGIDVLLEVEDGLSNVDFFLASKEFVRDRTAKPSSFYLFGGNDKPQSALGTYIFAKETKPTSNYPYNSYNSTQKKEEEKKEAKNEIVSQTSIIDDWEESWYEKWLREEEEAQYQSAAKNEKEEGNDTPLKFVATIRDEQSYIFPATTIRSSYWDVICKDCYQNEIAINWLAKAQGSPNKMADLNSVATTLFDAFMEDDTIDCFEIVNDKDEEVKLDTAQKIEETFEKEAVDYEVFNLAATEKGETIRKLKIVVSHKEETNNECK